MSDESKKIATWGEWSINYSRNVAEQEEWGPVTGISPETAYYRALAIANKRPSGQTEREVIAANAVRIAGVAETVEHFLPKVSGGQKDDEWGLARDIEFYLEGVAGHIAELESEASRSDKEIGVNDVAELTGYNYWTARPLGMLANLAERRRSAHQETLEGRLQETADFITDRLNSIPESPRRLVQAQVGMTLLSARAIARAA